MISGMNMLLRDMIVALSLRNIFLSFGKTGHEGPFIVLEDLQYWLEFSIGADYCDLKASLLI